MKVPLHALRERIAREGLWWLWGWRRAWRTHLLLAVLAGLALGLALAGSMIERAFCLATAHAAGEIDLVVGAPGGAADLVMATVFAQTGTTLPLLPAWNLDVLRADDRVAAAAPLMLADRHARGPIFGCDDHLRAIRPSLRVKTGRWFSHGNEAVAGAGAALNPGVQFHGTHGQDGDAHGEAWRVCGVLEPTGTPRDRVVFVPMDSLAGMHPGEAKSVQNNLSAILVKPKRISDAYALRAAYRSETTQAVFPGESLVLLYTWMGQAEKIIRLLVLAILLMVLALMAAVLAAQCRGRLPFLALARGMGAPPWYLAAGLWLEGISLHGLAGAMAFGWAFAFHGLAAHALWTESGLLLRGSITLREIALVSGFLFVGALGSTAVLPLAYSANPRKWLR